MVKPNFLYVGAPKCGSTWLFEALSQHPEVNLYKGKYIHFFKDFYHYGFGWYESKFSVKSGAKVVGDFATDYMFYDYVVERIAKKYPEMKLIVSLRNPIERDWSAYRFLQSTGEIEDSVSLNTAIRNSSDFLSLCSAYGTGVENLYKYFNKKQVLILFYEELKSDPIRYFNKVQAFLEIDMNFEPENMHKSAYKTRSSRLKLLNKVLKYFAWKLRTMGYGTLVMKLKRSKILKAIIFKEKKQKMRDITSTEREFLLERNRYEIDKLENILGVRLEHWKK